MSTERTQPVKCGASLQSIVWLGEVRRGGKNGRKKEGGERERFRIL